MDKETIIKQLDALRVGEYTDEKLVFDNAVYVMSHRADQNEDGSPVFSSEHIKIATDIINERVDKYLKEGMQ